MGYGEMEGNGSVHWQVVHEDTSGNPKNLTGRQGQAGRPSTADDVNLTAQANGRDGVAVADVGRRKGHRGRFRVRLRFENMADAKNAAAGAQNVMFENGMYVLVLDVPVIERSSPTDPPPPEVRVDW